MERGTDYKVTIIWALQSGTSAKDASCRVRAPDSRAVGGPTWEAMGASWAPPAYIIYETITKKQVSISVHNNNNNNRFTALSISIRTVK